MDDLFVSSSGDVLLWKAAKVPALQHLVNGSDEGVNHPLHIRGERVEGRPLRHGALEMSILVGLGTEQPLLCHRYIQEGSDEAELREQGLLQLLVVDDQEAMAELQPAQSVGRPPGGVAGHELRPFCNQKKTIN